MKKIEPKVGMRVLYKDNHPKFGGFTILSVDKHKMRIKWVDGWENETTANLDEEVRLGASITSPKQETLRWIKENL